MTSPFGAEISRIFEKHRDNVAGVNLSVIRSHQDFHIDNFSFGFAREDEPMTPSHYLQCASLSKTVCAAFSIEYFTYRGIDLNSTSVNDLLKNANSHWRIVGKDSSFHGDDVTVVMLLNHTALGMHYVYGIPLTDTFPNALELLNGGAERYGYKKLLLEREAGESFSYSGGGFVVMQHLIETMEGGAPLAKIARNFLDSVGLADFTFSQISKTHAEELFAMGYIVPFSKPVDPPLVFPPFAAGGLCTPNALATFLCHLSRAYENFNGSGGISHQTAVLMLGEDSLIDKGAMDFIGARIGLGVFVAKAGPSNRFMLHQAANDGFRGVYLHCFTGPDAGKGCVVLCNGDNAAVLMQCEILCSLLGHKCLFISEGIDLNQFNCRDSAVDMSVQQEAIVNKGLLDLVMVAFQDNEPTTQASVRAKL